MKPLNVETRNFYKEKSKKLIFNEVEESMLT